MPPMLQRNMASRAALSLIAGTLAAALWIGCGDDGNQGAAPSCFSAPTSCAAGTTCWPTDSTGGAACLASKSYKVRGDDCELILGDTSCGDGLVCVSAATMKGDGSVVQSFCAGWCDAAGKGCAGDETCTKLSLLEGAPAVWVCVPASLPRDHAKDGGVDGGM